MNNAPWPFDPTRLDYDDEPLTAQWYIDHVQYDEAARVCGEAEEFDFSYPRGEYDRLQFAAALALRGWILERLAGTTWIAYQFVADGGISSW